MIQPSRGVFLSYASEDASVANRICGALRNAGIEVWFDQSELRGGDAWDQKIRRQIRDCALFVPIVSEHTQARPEGYFRLEWKLAVDRSHLMAAEKAFIVPVAVDATMESDALVPTQFRDVQWTRIRAGEVPPTFVDRIAALLNEPVAPHVGSRERGVSRKHTRFLSVALIALSITAGVALTIAAAMRGGWLWQWQAPKIQASAASAPVASTPAAIAEKSVAVLPFIDLSEKKDQAYFADGLAEELIDRLTRIQGLRVPARTSSFYFRDKALPVSAIANALGVAYIVEGSVRRERNIARVTAQLIRADSGNHVWSVTYERPMQDILETEHAIAIAIAAALKVTVNDKTSYGGYATTSPEAFDLYLQAKDQTQKSYSIGDLKLRLSKANRSVSLDPTFSDGWSEVARLSEELAARQGDTDGTLAKAANNALRRAIESDHVTAKILTRVGVAYLTFDFDARKAISAFRRARDLDPEGTQGLFAQGTISSLQGDTARALTAFRKMVELNPYTEPAIWMETGALASSGRWTDAEIAIKRDLALSPEDESSMSFAAYILTMTGKPHEALEMANRIEKSPELRSSVLPLIYEALDRKADAAAALEDLIKRFGDRMPYIIAGIYAHESKIDQAFVWLNRAYAVRDVRIWDIRCDPMLEPLRSDARYARLLQQLGLID